MFCAQPLQRTFIIVSGQKFLHHSFLVIVSGQKVAGTTLLNGNPIFVELCLLMVLMYTELVKFVLCSSWKKKYMYIHKANRLKEQIIYMDNLK